MIRAETLADDLATLEHQLEDLHVPPDIQLRLLQTKAQIALLDSLQASSHASSQDGDQPPAQDGDASERLRQRDSILTAQGHARGRARAYGRVYRELKELLEDDTATTEDLETLRDRIRLRIDEHDQRAEQLYSLTTHGDQP